MSRTSRILVGLAALAVVLTSLVGPAAGSTSAGVAVTARHHRPAPAARPVVLRLTYTVKAGDTLSSIARRYGTRVSALRAANHLRRRSILRVGRRLRIPPITISGPLVAHLPRVIVKDPRRLRLVPLFRAAAREAGVPADLLMAVAFRESRWDATARSRTGAMGIGQLMPTTVQWVSHTLLRSRVALNPWEPIDNLRMSARTLALLLRLTKGDVHRGLAAYYQGYGSLVRDGVLPVGRRYADSILALRASFNG